MTGYRLPSRHGTRPEDPAQAAREDRRAERVAAFGFLVAAAAGAGLAVVYWRGGQPQLEGLLLGVGFAGLAYGFVTWGNRLLHEGEASEPRHQFGSEADQEAFGQDLEREGTLPRRTLLVRSLGAAVVGMGAAALFPLRSLGPRPGRSLYHTSFRRGTRLVTEDNRPINVADVPLNGLVTAFPEGDAGSATGQTVLMRVDPGLIRPRPGREDWSPQGFIAYSKICSHAGCPVGLFQASTQQLLCPCHQSAFDVLDGARAVSGPAAAPLPQLPLAIDPSGYLYATGDYPEPVGPAFWHRYPRS